MLDPSRTPLSDFTSARPAMPALQDPRRRNLDGLIGSVADSLNSEVAPYCQLDGKGQPPEVIYS